MTKHQWIRRNELKAVEVERVERLRAARVRRPSPWKAFAVKIRAALKGVVEFFQKIGAVVRKATESFAEFLARAVPIVEHQQHQLPMLPSLNGYATIGEWS